MTGTAAGTADGPTDGGTLLAANQGTSIPGYWRFDAFAEAKLDKNWTAKLFVNNILDNRYETFGTFAPNGHLAGNPVERFLTPASPISVLAGLRYEY